MEGKVKGVSARELKLGIPHPPLAIQDTKKVEEGLGHHGDNPAGIQGQVLIHEDSQRSEVQMKGENVDAVFHPAVSHESREGLKKVLELETLLKFKEQEM